MDFRAALAHITRYGSRHSETIAAHLPPALVQFERFTDCGHGVVRDAPGPHFEVLRGFITR